MGTRLNVGRLCSVGNAANRWTVRQEEIAVTGRCTRELWCTGPELCTAYIQSSGRLLQGAKSCRSGHRRRQSRRSQKDSSWRESIAWLCSIQDCEPTPDRRHGFEVRQEVIPGRLGLVILRLRSDMGFCMAEDSRGSFPVADSCSR